MGEVGTGVSIRKGRMGKRKGAGESHRIEYLPEGELQERWKQKKKDLESFVVIKLEISDHSLIQIFPDGAGENNTTGNLHAFYLLLWGKITPARFYGQCIKMPLSPAKGRHYV